MDYELKNAPKSNDTILSIYNLDIEKADSSDGLYDCLLYTSDAADE